MCLRKIRILVAFLLIALLPFPFVSCNADQNDDDRLLILNARLYSEGKVMIENSAVVVEDGKVTLLADATIIRLDMAHYTEVIEAAGMHLYFFDQMIAEDLVAQGIVHESTDSICQYFQDTNLASHWIIPEIGLSAVFYVAENPVSDITSVATNYVYFKDRLYTCL